MGGLTAADRNRFEKLISYPEAPVRYRNQLLFDYAVSRAHFFLDDEVFFNLSAGDFNQNRLQAGGGALLSAEEPCNGCGDAGDRGDAADHSDPGACGDVARAQPVRDTSQGAVVIGTTGRLM